MNLINYIVKDGEKINLKKFSTVCDSEIKEDKVRNELMPKAIREINKLQEKLFAENTYGILVVFQAMDAAGKDSTINHVFSNLNPAGVHVNSFKQPSIEEKDHDYMWRINKALPCRGEIGIFNRSHYEEVIVSKIHDLIKSDNLPQELISKNIWEKRYRQIRDWEKYLTENGFQIIKIFLHVSKEEQKKRLIDRILVKKKNWKFSLADINERKYWDHYQRTYEEMLTATSTKYAPWYIVPADDKWYTRYVVASIVLEELKKINPQFPSLDPEVQKQLDQFRRIMQEVDIETIKDISNAIKTETPDIKKKE